MTKAEYRYKRHWERCYKRNNRYFDPILGVIDASVDCTCGISIGGDYTVLNSCRRHAVEEFHGNGSTTIPWKTTSQQDKLLATLTSEDYD